jgi:hypothetical protein
MSVTVRPYQRGGWEVDIVCRSPDGRLRRERQRVTVEFEVRRPQERVPPCLCPSASPDRCAVGILTVRLASEKRHVGCHEQKRRRDMTSAGSGATSYRVTQNQARKRVLRTRRKRSRRRHECESRVRRPILPNRADQPKGLTVLSFDPRAQTCRVCSMNLAESGVQQSSCVLQTSLGD